MQVIRNFVFRLYPSTEQKRRLLFRLESHRRLYNAALWEKRHHWRLTGEHLPYLAQQNRFLKWWKESHPECKVLGSQALQETVRRVDRAFKNFYVRLKKGLPAGPPRFKSPTRFKSFTFPGPAGWKYLGGRGKKHVLKITNLGLLKMRGRPRVPLLKGEPRCLTIKKKGDRWFAIVSVRLPLDLLKRKRISTGKVGIDPGSFHLVTLSNGEKIKALEPLKHNLRRLRSLQKALSRKVKDSKRYLKTKRVLGRLHEKIANQRKDFLHKLSADLVRRYDFIAIEGMDLQRIVRKGGGNKAGFNRRFYDAGIGMFTAMLVYKAEEAGGRCVVVTPDSENAYTRLCSRCGADIPKSLKQRMHRCKICGFELDRDVNAALNILSAVKDLGRGPAPRGGKDRLPDEARNHLHAQHGAW